MNYLVDLFSGLVNMSAVASIVILFVLAARLLLKRAPKIFSYALWAIVLVRLLVPISIPSPVSAVPQIQATAGHEINAALPAIEFEAPGNREQNIIIQEQNITNPEQPIENNEAYRKVNHSVEPAVYLTIAWLVGIGIMLLYSVISYLGIRQKVRIVVPLRDNIFIADDIKSPFAVGFIRPKIYLPCNLDEREQEYIILHEQHHIRRLDHIAKALAFLALSIHWFNPLVWVAFILACKDMEMSCDEAVIRKMGEDIRADYSASLLTLATGRRIIAGAPIDFGEGDTKDRIRNLSRWKKPAIWVIVIVVIFCIVLSVCLLTNQSETGTSTQNTGYYVITGNVLKYRDESTGGDGIPVCPQPGCKHLDSTCQAWIEGDAAGWKAYDGSIYVTVNTEEGARFVEKDLTTGEEQVIASWENIMGENQEIWNHAWGFCLSGGEAIIPTQEDLFCYEKFEVIQESEFRYLRVDLETGEKSILFPNEDAEEISVRNFCGNQALVTYNPWKEPRDILTEEEFHQQYGEDASYGRYKQLNSGRELRLYDLESGEYTVLASAEDGFTLEPDGMSTYGTKSLYKMGNDLHLYDIATGEDRLFVTMDNIVNYWLFDHEVFIITKSDTYFDPDVEYRYYYASLEDGVPVEVGRNSDGQMAFMPYVETANYFYGIYADDQRRSWITKEDFFAGNYDRAY